MDFLYRYETLGTGAGRVKMDEEAGYSPQRKKPGVAMVMKQAIPM